MASSSSPLQKAKRGVKKKVQRILKGRLPTEPPPSPTPSPRRTRWRTATPSPTTPTRFPSTTPPSPVPSPATPTRFPGTTPPSPIPSPTTPNPELLAMTPVRRPSTTPVTITLEMIKDVFNSSDSIWAYVPYYHPDRADLPGVDKPGWAIGVVTLAKSFHQLIKGDTKDLEAVADFSKWDFSGSDCAEKSEESFDMVSVDERQYYQHRRHRVRDISTPRTATASSEFNYNSADLVGVTHKTSKKHLEHWIAQCRPRIQCDVTATGWPPQAAHLIEKRWSKATRMAVYYAIMGWISPNSRINYLFLRTDIHERLDRNTIFIYIESSTILDELNKYIDTITIHSTSPVDWVSLLRTQHPLLCDGTLFDYKIAVMEGSPLDFEKDKDITGHSFNSFAHPLAVLVRMCFLFDQIQKQAVTDFPSWWTTQITQDKLLTLFAFPPPDLAVIEKNIKFAAYIRLRMAQVLQDEQHHWFARRLAENPTKGRKGGGGTSRGGGRKGSGRGGGGKESGGGGGGKESGGGGGEKDAGGGGGGKDFGRAGDKGDDKDHGQGSGKPKHQGGNVEGDFVHGIERDSKQPGRSESIHFPSDDRSSDWGSSAQESTLDDYPCDFHPPSYYYDNDEARKADRKLIYEQTVHDAYCRVESKVREWILNLQGWEENQVLEDKEDQVVEENKMLEEKELQMLEQSQVSAESQISEGSHGSASLEGMEVETQVSTRKRTLPQLRLMKWLNNPLGVSL